MIKEMTADKKRFIPKTGFNVVGFDDFEPPGEQLYLVGHYDNEEAAKAEMAKRKKASPDGKFYLYGPETK